MSYIKMNLSTSKEGDVEIQVKSECTQEELQVAAVSIMGMVAVSSGVEVLDKIMKDLKDSKDGNKDRD